MEGITSSVTTIDSVENFTLKMDFGDMDLDSVLTELTGSRPVSPTYNLMEDLIPKQYSEMRNDDLVPWEIQ
jgi:hypothetical protein